MATPTYDLLDSVTLSSSAASVTFSSIDQSYRDLIVVANYLGNGGASYAYYQFNGDTGTNYYLVYAQGNGSSAFSGTLTDTRIFPQNGATATQADLSVLQIMDYSTTDKHKTCLHRGNGIANGVSMDAARWANTSAISSITITAFSNNFASGGTFYLYGVAA